MSTEAHETTKPTVNRRDPTDCEACGEVEYEPCLYHQGVMDGYALACRAVERAL